MCEQGEDEDAGSCGGFVRAPCDEDGEGAGLRHAEAARRHADGRQQAPDGVCREQLAQGHVDADRLHRPPEQHEVDGEVPDDAHRHRRPPVRGHARQTASLIDERGLDLETGPATSHTFTDAAIEPRAEPLRQTGGEQHADERGDDDEPDDSAGQRAATHSLRQGVRRAEQRDAEQRHREARHEVPHAGDDDRRRDRCGLKPPGAQHQVGRGDAGRATAGQEVAGRGPCDVDDERLDVPQPGYGAGQREGVEPQPERDEREQFEAARPPEQLQMPPDLGPCRLAEPRHAPVQDRRGQADADDGLRALPRVGTRHRGRQR